MSAITIPSKSADSKSTRAAQYIRMSTEHQRYSADNQAAENERYAADRGLDIVRTYADLGRSGLTLGARPGLQQLLHDVESGAADYVAILVYDVSRWGRFQDPDEAAACEVVCKRKGIAVHYCAERFENDSSPTSVLLKSIKRLMAGEYSRELSDKVFAGQCASVRRGYHRGGQPGYALRRQLVDDEGRPTQILSAGEWKNIQSNRVVLVHGPAEEVTTVRRIYHIYVDGKLREAKIARVLNDVGVPGPTGGRWAPYMVHKILINPKYVGEVVYNRRARRLSRQDVCNPPDQWVRCTNAVEPIISRDLFDAAQHTRACQFLYASNEHLLELLAGLCARTGHLSRTIIDAAPDVPRGSTYAKRFGSLGEAYRRIGYVPLSISGYLPRRRARIRIRESIVRAIRGHFAERGIAVDRLNRTGVLTIDGRFRVLVAAYADNNGELIKLRQNLHCTSQWRLDATLIACTDRLGERVHCYYVVPWSTVDGEPSNGAADGATATLEAFRRNAFADVYRLAEEKLASKADRQSDAPDSGCSMELSASSAQRPTQSIKASEQMS